MAHYDRDLITEFLARVNFLLAEAKATKAATMAQTDHILARELVARREEMLVHLVPTQTIH